MKLKELFFHNTLRHWHFEQLVKESDLSRERVNFYLKQLLKEKFILKVKPKKKMPYYIANKENPKFRIEKKLFGLTMLDALFEEIISSKKIKTAILFGSFARGDWNNSSDIDLLIYGDDQELEKGKIELKLKREIQLFSYKNLNEIKNKLDCSTINNIIKGFNIKGTLEPFEVKLNA